MHALHIICHTGIHVAAYSASHAFAQSSLFAATAGWWCLVPRATCRRLRACSASLRVCFECVQGGRVSWLAHWFGQIGRKNPNHLHGDLRNEFSNGIGNDFWCCFVCEIEVFQCKLKFPPYILVSYCCIVCLSASHGCNCPALPPTFAGSCILGVGAFDRLHLYPIICIVT